MLPRFLAEKSFDQLKASRPVMGIAERAKLDKAHLERERLKSYLDIEPIDLSEDEVSELVTFMHALTGKESIWGKLGRPGRVPSGLPVD